MRRISGANTLDIGSGRLGYRDRNLALGQPGTVVPGTNITDFQEEIARTVEVFGQALDGNNREQLLQALRRASATTQVGVGPGPVSRTLTVDECGRVIVGASAGAIALTLPSAAAAGGHPVRSTIIRWDSSAFAVTLAAAAGQTIEGGASITIPRNSRVTLISDGISDWHLVSEVAAGRSLANNGWYRLPGGLLLQWGQFGGTSDVPGGTNVVVSGTFPTTFPSACFQIIGTLIDTSPNRTAAITSADATTTGGAFVVQEFVSNVQSLGVRYLAIGA